VNFRCGCDATEELYAAGIPTLYKYLRYAMWVMVFFILVHGGQWIQIQDSPTGRDYLHMNFESQATCTNAALERDLKLVEVGLIAQFKCVELERE
jgi:hypothetical protein